MCIRVRAAGSAPAAVSRLVAFVTAAVGAGGVFTSPLIAEDEREGLVAFLGLYGAVVEVSSGPLRVPVLAPLALFHYAAVSWWAPIRATISTRSDAYIPVPASRGRGPPSLCSR